MAQQAPAEGLEPSHSRLTAACSTDELRWKNGWQSTRRAPGDRHPLRTSQDQARSAQVLVLRSFQGAGEPLPGLHEPCSLQLIPVLHCHLRALRRGFETAEGRLVSRGGLRIPDQGVRQPTLGFHLRTIRRQPMARAADATAARRVGPAAGRAQPHAGAVA